MCLHRMIDEIKQQFADEGEENETESENERDAE